MTRPATSNAPEQGARARCGRRALTSLAVIVGLVILVLVSPVSRAEESRDHTLASGEGTGSLEGRPSMKIDPALSVVIGDEGVEIADRFRFVTRRPSAPDRRRGALEPTGSDELQYDVTLCFLRELGVDEALDRETLSDGLELRRLTDGELANVGRFYPAWATSGALQALAADPLIERIEPGSPPRIESPLMMATSEVEADLRHVAYLGGAPGRRNVGKGIVIATFDSGIDVFHPDFFFVDEEIEPYDWIDVDGNRSLDPFTDCVDVDRDGICGPEESLGALTFSDTSREWYFIDANGNGVRDFGTNKGFAETDLTYGERLLIVERAVPHEAVRPGQRFVPLGASKIRAVLGSGGVVYRRGVDLIHTPSDPSGHGTSVASILVSQTANRGRAIVGVAPGAELVVVDRNSNSNHVANLAWARAEGADVYLWEFGGWTNVFLDGSTALEQAMSAGMNRVDTPEVHVIPNGNLSGSMRHARIEVQSNGSAAVPLTVPVIAVPFQTVWISVHWHGFGSDLGVGFARAGEPSTPLILGGERTVSGHNLLTSQVFRSSRDWNRIDVFFFRRAPGGFASIDAGEWVLTVTNPNSDAKIVHTFVADDQTSWSGGVRWSSHTTDDSSITWPATADHALSVGAYTGDRLEPYSGRGPTIDGRTDVLDIAAPGNVSEVALPTDSGAFSLYGSFSGTSAAGPFVAGAAALLLEAVPRRSGEMTGIAIRDAIRSGALAPELSPGDPPLPNDAWGYGKLRADAAYQLLSEMGCATLPELTAIAPLDEGTVSPNVGAALEWSDLENAEVYDVYLGKTNPPPLAFVDLPDAFVETGALDPGEQYWWRVVARNTCDDPGEHPGGPASASPVRSFFTTGDRFRRGDCNSDGFFDLSDPITLLLSMFAPGSLAVPFRCADACDYDDNGQLSITDALNALTRLTLGGLPPSAPFPGCGEDTTPDGLDCFAYESCF